MTGGTAAVAYDVRRSRRARHLRVTVDVGGRVVVTLPYRFPLAAAARLIRDKEAWIISKVAYFTSLERPVQLTSTVAEYRKYRSSTERLVRRLAAELAPKLGVVCRYVSIRRQRRRWGSCSQTGRLNFNYKLIFLPEPLAEYVVAHELCHIKVFNHSRAFWALVQTVLPDYSQRRRELRRWVVV